MCCFGGGGVVRSGVRGVVMGFGYYKRRRETRLEPGKGPRACSGLSIPPQTAAVLINPTPGAKRPVLNLQLRGGPLGPRPPLLRPLCNDDGRRSAHHIAPGPSPWQSSLHRYALVGEAGPHSWRIRSTTGHLSGSVPPTLFYFSRGLMLAPPPFALAVGSELGRVFGAWCAPVQLSSGGHVA